MHKHAFSNLLVHVPQMIEVRFHLPNLISAVGRRIAAEVLSAWQSAGPDGAEPACSEALLRAGLVPGAQQRYAFTALGERLLRDDFGARLDDSLAETYRRAGLAAALRRADSLGEGPLGPRRVEQLAAEAVQRLMSELRHAASFAAHERALSALTARLAELSEQVAAQAARSAEARRQLQQNCERERQRRDAAPAEGDAAPNASHLKLPEWLSWRKAAAARALRPAHAQRGGDETLLWEAALRQAVLEGEGRLLAAVADALADELATDTQSLAVIGEGLRAAVADAEASEGVRDWELAAGEILLNGREMTEAAIAQLWPDARALQALIFSKYAAAEDGEQATLTDEVVTAETVEGIKQVVEEVVARAMSEWTITDALAALAASDSDLPRRIGDAIRQLTDRDFLATGYDQLLPRAHFAIITCAPSRLAVANSFFNCWVESLSQELEVEFSVEADPLLDDCLCCYLENFSVPLSALGVCEEYVEDESGGDPAASPLFTPHPDILPAGIHAAPTAVAALRADAEEESEVLNVAG